MAFLSFESLAAFLVLSDRERFLHPVLLGLTVQIVSCVLVAAAALRGLLGPTGTRLLAVTCLLVLLGGGWLQQYLTLPVMGALSGVVTAVALYGDGVPALGFGGTAVLQTSVGLLVFAACTLAFPSRLGTWAIWVPAVVFLCFSAVMYSRWHRERK